MSIGIRTLGMPTLPYQWKDRELPYDLDCSVNVGAAWASMGELSKNAWVPVDWKVTVQLAWDDLERDLRSGHFPVPRNKKIDHWSVEKVAKHHCPAISRHAEKMQWLHGQISDQRKKPSTTKLTPKEWLGLRGCFQTFHLKPTDWDSETEEEKYLELIEFLTGRGTPEEVHVAKKNQPKLTEAQAQGVLWFLNVVTGLDTNDIRLMPCGMCGKMADTNETTSCEGCGLHVCYDCFAGIAGDCDLEEEPWWPEGHSADNYCEKCIALIVKHYKSDAAETPESNHP